MSKNFQKLLNDYYRSKSIHPEDFNCPYQTTCRMHATQGRMTETKMSMVGSQYGVTYPKIVVVSLDPPSGKKANNTNARWRFITPKQRTIEYISSTHEKDNYIDDHANPIGL